MLSHSEAGRFTSQFKTDGYEQESNVPRARRASDPADPAVTKRVITIMLAEEY
jgi:hypothetical protein